MHPVNRLLLVASVVFVVWTQSAARVDGFAILAQTNSLVQTNNGTIVNNKTVFTIFTDNDFGVTFVFSVLGTDGVTRGLSITAPPVARPYFPLGWGLIPSEGKLRASEICEVFNTIRYNASLPQYLLQDPTGRQLLSVFDFIEDFAVGFTCSGGLGTLGSVGIGIASGAVGRNVCGGGNTVPDELLGDLSGKIDNLKIASDNLLASQRTLFGNISALFQDIIATNDQLNQFDFKLLEQQRALTAAVNASQNAINAIAAEATRESRVVQGQFRDVNTQIIALAGAIEAASTGTTAALSGYVIQLMGFINSTNLALSNLTGITINDKTAILTTIRQVTKSVRDINTNLQLLATRQSMILKQTAGIWTLLRRDISEGLYTPFLVDLGTEPSVSPFNLGGFANLPIDNVWSAYTWINPADSQPWAVLTTATYRCGSYYIVTHPYQATYWQDLAEFMGPANCSTTQEGVSYCNCWVSWSEQQCPIITSSSGVADETVYQAFRASNAQQLSGTLCIGGAGAIVTTTPLATPIGLAGTVSLALTDFVISLKVVGRRGTCSSNVGGASCVQRGYTQFDNLRISDNIAYDSRLATGEFLALLSGTTTPNFLNSFFNKVTQMYGLVILYMDVVQERIFGSPPDGLTMMDIPFRRDPSTHVPMSCTRWTFVTYGTDPSTFISVGVMRPGAVTPSVVVEVTGNPTLVLQTNLVLSNAQTYLLPDYTPYIGDPMSSTIQYNAGNDQIVISPNPISRAGAVTYAVVGALVDFLLPVWEFVNGMLFDHPSGSNFASTFINNIHPSTGLCVPVQTANVTVFNGGNWCAMRENFIVVPNPGGGYVDYIGRSDILLANVVVPEGEIVALQGSSCPQLGTPTFGSSSMLLTLQNTLSGPGPNLITYQVFSTLCPLFAEVSINPLSTKQIQVDFCAQNPPGVFDTLFFFYTVESNLVQCPDTVNITSYPQNIPRVTGPGSLQLTETLRSLSTDTTLIALNNITTQLTNVLFQVIQQSYVQAQYLPIPTPEFIIGNTTDLFNQLRAIQLLSQGYIIEGRNQSVDYTALIAPFTQQYNDNINKSQVAWEEALRISQTTAVLVANSKVRSLILDQASADYLNKSAIYFDANLAVSRATLAAFQSLSDQGLDFANFGPFLESLCGLAAGPLGDLLDFITDIPGQALDLLKSIPGAVLDFLDSALGKLLNSTFGAIMTIIGIALGAGGFAIGLYLCFKGPMGMATTAAPAATPAAPSASVAVAASAATAGRRIGNNNNAVRVGMHGPPSANSSSSSSSDDYDDDTGRIELSTSS